MDDVPSEDGHLKLLKCSGSLEKAQIHQVSLKDNVMGTDIVANPNNIQATQQSERDRRSLFLILSCIKPESNLYRTLSDARFTTGRQAWTYLQASGIVYNPPSQSTAMEHKHRVAKWTWMNLPRDQQDKFLCIKFMGLLLGHNPMLHPSFLIFRSHRQEPILELESSPVILIERQTARELCSTRTCAATLAKVPHSRHTADTRTWPSSAHSRCPARAATPTSTASAPRAPSVASWPAPPAGCSSARRAAGLLQPCRGVLAAPA